jgi:NADH-quinone oxidoreductase subunit C/D
MEEMEQSAYMIEQMLDRMPAGPVIADEWEVALPTKGEVYGSIEGMIRHFKLITDGIRPPAGEIYSCTEAANGELGFYIVSDGTERPHRVKVRPPCFAVYQAFPKLVEGHMVADAVAILASLNVIAGELDR